ncbi:MAG: hypothetical protein ABIC91_00100 [Nanoarchaeota archaeon]|nr:hypothetical protein [Nanoarchaeota archaeon]MBU1029614.1 hypothetical protein [Nanoarchaeota archaeon]MBU1850233.1 hypothetical protein [Nanoarchaeota archaeon]
MKKKSQLSLEFMSFLSFAILLSIILLVVINITLGEKITEKNFLELKNLGYSIQRELILATEVYDGYSRTIFVPEQINSLDYSLSNTDRLLIIRFEETDITFPIPKINGVVVKGNNTIRKTAGVVYIDVE